MTLQGLLQQIGTALSSSVTNVYHYTRPQGLSSFLVWQEDGEATSFHADNHLGEQAIHGTCDYFTKTEFDSAIDTIQEVLDGLMITWSLQSVQYEDETEFIHYEWEWSVSWQR